MVKACCVNHKEQICLGCISFPWCSVLKAHEEAYPDDFHNNNYRSEPKVSLLQSNIEKTHSKNQINTKSHYWIMYT